MANQHNEDILRPMRRDEIQNMFEICGKSLPLSIRGYNFLRMTIRLNDQFDNNPAGYEQFVVSDYMRRKIYTKRDGNLENCTFISISGPNDYSVFVFSNDVNELRECLMHTNLIEYGRGPYFISFEGRHREMLAEVFDYRKVAVDYEVSNSGRILSKAVALKLEYKQDIPNDVVLKSLRIDDAHVINEMWPHQYPGSLELIKTLIGVNDAIGVFSKDNHELRAWILLREYFELGMMQTLPIHRGKGYAKILIKAMSKIIASKYDLDVLVFIVRGNNTAEHIFTKLGFIQHPMEDEYSWIFMKKQ